MVDAINSNDAALSALLLERADDSLDHAVLFRAVRGDELLLQPVALDQRRVAAAGEDQAVVRAQQEGLVDLAQAAVAGDQGLLQYRLGRLGSSTAVQVLAQRYSLFFWPVRLQPRGSKAEPRRGTSFPLGTSR